MLGPGEEVDCEHHDGQPSGVDRERSGREVIESGVLRGANAVLDAGVRTVPRVEVSELSERSVGGKGGVAPAVTFFERVELGARMRSFAAHDHPCSGGRAA
jgi:hypothetical protein